MTKLAGNEQQNVLPEDSQARKDIPITTGVLDYFPAAIAYVAKISKIGNDKHNPGQPLHWARGKSQDHADCIPRHLIDRGGKDKDGIRHSGYLAWRSLALLEEELEREEGSPLPRGAWSDDVKSPEPKREETYEERAARRNIVKASRAVPGTEVWQACGSPTCCTEFDK